MNVFNVHSNRSPVDCVVKERWYFPGAFVQGRPDKHRSRTSATRWGCETPDGRDDLRAGRGAHRRRICAMLTPERAEAGRALRLHPLRLTGGRLSAARCEIKRRSGKVYAAQSVLAWVKTPNSKAK